MARKSQRKYIIPFVIVTFALVLAACASDDGTSQEPVAEEEEAAEEPAAEEEAAEEEAAEEEAVEEVVEEEPFKVALIVSGELQDGSWNQFQFESMQELEAVDGFEVAMSENVDVPDFERVATDYCREGFDLIVAHTFDYQEPALSISDAGTCPETVIAGQGFREFRDNVAGFTIWPCEGGYLAGVMGASVTQSDKIGVIGGFTYSPTQLCFHEAYKLGAQSINADIEISEIWTETWFDVALGFEAGNAMIEDGVDFIAISLSGPGIGAIDAAAAYNAEGPDSKVYVFGAFIDMNSRAPDTVISSSVWRTSGPLLTLIETIKDGTFEGTNYQWLMADGGSVLAPYHDIEGELSQEAKDTVDQVLQDILDGTLVVPQITTAEG